MVKQLIDALLKKKQEVQSSKGTSDVPDELPSLAEDVIKKSEQIPDELPSISIKPAQQQSQKAPDIRQVEVSPPDELPPVSKAEDIELPQRMEPKIEQPELNLVSKFKEHFANKYEVKAENYSAPSVKEEPKRVPPGIDASGASAFNPSPQLSGSSPKPGSKTQGQPNMAENTKGFFSNIINHVKDQGAREKLLSGDLFSRMNNYWELRKTEISTGTALSGEQQLEQDLLKHLTELQDLESRWQAQKITLDESLSLLHQYELAIQIKITEFSKLLNELKLFKNVPPEKYFCLFNGVIIKNLHELINVLEIIDDETFNHHVSYGRNDFSNWIRDVLKDNNLADKLANSKTKADMIKVLETEPINKDSKKSNFPLLSPEQYLKLSNGVVIRSLYELSDAIRIIDDATFKNHVTDNKNDFSAWVRNIIKNEYLAESLLKIKEKNQMVSLLDAFL